MQLPTFSVVSMMREEASVIERFVRYYRHAGAAQIMIFYDGSVSELGNADLEGVEVVECTSAFWDTLCGGRPETLEDAQFACFGAGHRACRSDWLLVVDADEFVFGDMPFREFLSRTPETELVVRIPVAEAAWGPGDDLEQPFGSTYFRTALPPRASRILGMLLYGWRSLGMRRGVYGHWKGKQVLRTRGNYSQIGNHIAFVDGRQVGRYTHEISPDLRGIYVGHFDAISFPRWREKCLRRSQITTVWTPGYRMKLMQQLNSLSEPEARLLFRRMYRVKPWQIAVMRALGAIQRRDIFAEVPRIQTQSHPTS